MTGVCHGLPAKSSATRTAVREVDTSRAPFIHGRRQFISTGETRAFASCCGPQLNLTQRRSAPEPQPQGKPAETAETGRAQSFSDALSLRPSHLGGEPAWLTESRCTSMWCHHAFAGGCSRSATGTFWKTDRGMGTQECNRTDRSEEFSALIPMSPFPCHFRRRGLVAALPRSGLVPLRELPDFCSLLWLGPC